MNLLRMLSDEELDNKMKEKYGENWGKDDIDPEDELVQEIFNRACRGEIVNDPRNKKDARWAVGVTQRTF